MILFWFCEEKYSFQELSLSLWYLEKGSLIVAFVSLKNKTQSETFEKISIKF